MAKTLPELAQNLSLNLVQLREKRNLSQSALAKLTKVPRSTITHLESGSGNPSLQNLSKIAGGLQVSIEELLSRPRHQCTLIRRQDLKILKRAQGLALIFKLLPDPIPGMEIDRMELAPDARMTGIPHLQNTKEYLICFQGSVEVVVAGETYKLEKGDVFAFPGNLPHSYINRERATAICLSVVALAPSMA